jgi:DNA-binding SARP family transcriptional activator
VTDSTTALSSATAVHLLGRPSIICPAHNGDDARSIGPGKPLVLLARLIMEPRGLSRAAAMAFLWSEMPEFRARASLRQAVYLLTVALGAGVIGSTRQYIVLNCPVECDLTNFMRASAAGDDAAAVQAYRGPFMEDLSLVRSTEAEQWVSFERFRLERLFRRAAAQHVAAAVAHGDWHTAVATATRLRDLSPDEPQLWRPLLGTLMRAGHTDTLSSQLAELRARQHAALMSSAEETELLLSEFRDLPGGTQVA